MAELDKSGAIVRNYDKPILKDTIMMPDGGYVVVRFKALNPGTILFSSNLAAYQYFIYLFIFVVHPESGLEIHFQVVYSLIVGKQILI